MFSFRQMITVGESQPIGWLFVILETTLLLGVIQPVKEELAYRAMPRELAYSLLYSGFAMSTFYYGYGIVQLRTIGPLNDFLCRICGSSLKVWINYSFLMMLPWSLKVLEQIEENFRCLWKCIADNDNEVAYIYLSLGITCFLAQLIFLSISFISAIKYSYQLTSSLHINQIIGNHEIRAYAQSLNNSLGFDMIQIPENE